MTNAQIRHENIVYRSKTKMWRGNYTPASIVVKPEPKTDWWNDPKDWRNN